MRIFKCLKINEIKKIPKGPGVYAFKKNGKFLYVGKAVNLKERAKQHSKIINLAKEVCYLKSKSEEEALLLEARLIKKHQPKYNVSWKDDKNYFYVGITKEAFPRIFITHRAEKRSRTEYLGPFTSGRKLKQRLKELRKDYPYRTCVTLPKKPCLWYHLKQCPAPCLFGSERIEAYDIANIQGKEATGSMVTFIKGKPDKNFYRRFKIKLSNQPNDLAMLKEVISRRLRHKEWPYPNLILVDGGRAHLNIASFLTEIPVMSIAKKKEKLYMKNMKKPIYLKDLSRKTFNLFLQLRDEAHRFANQYHHHLRKKHLFN